MDRLARGIARRAVPGSRKMHQAGQHSPGGPLGYRLGLQVEENSQGSIRMSPGTLYENLHKLARRGFIREVEELATQKPALALLAALGIGILIGQALSRR